MWNECPRRKDECGPRGTVPLALKDFKTGGALVRISDNRSSWEIVMSRTNFRIAPAAFAACAVLLPAASALASQGPGGGMGTAGSLTRIAMAVVVYGTAALIIGTGLIGALRRR
jgi:hypothetical protein